MGESAWSVKKLPVVDADSAAKIKQQIGYRPAPGPTLVAAPTSLKPTQPGKERWPVKTGVDADVSKVTKQIVPATVDELAGLQRPTSMADPNKAYKAFQNKRSGKTETTIWQVDCTIIAIKQEADGDFHLVLQGASGDSIVAEVPDPNFVGPTSPFRDDITTARAAVQKKFMNVMTAAPFVPMGKYQVPAASYVKVPAKAKPTSLMPSAGAPASPPAFKSAVKATKVRITGVGFFDRLHGQTGGAPNGIELHPVLGVKFT